MDTKVNNYTGLILTDNTRWFGNKESNEGMATQVFPAAALSIQNAASVNAAALQNNGRQNKVERNKGNDKRGTKRRNLYAVAGYDRRLGDRRVEA